jgi:hypothetical protein
MIFNEEVFKPQFDVVFFFVRQIAYYRGLWALRDNITGYKDFWESTINAHLLVASLAWCNVFGSRSSDLHWTKTPAGEMTDQLQEDFRQKILSEIGFSLEEWEKYQKRMMDFRNKFAAHVDIINPFKGPIPDFDPALQVAYAYQEWTKELIWPKYLHYFTLKTKYEEWKADASAVLTIFFSNSK